MRIENKGSKLFRWTQFYFFNYIALLKKISGGCAQFRVDVIIPFNILELFESNQALV